MNRLVLLGLIPVALAGPVVAQPMGQMSMPGMTMPMSTKASPAKAHAAHAAKRAKTKDARAQHHHASRHRAAMAGMTMPAAAVAPADATGDMSGMAGMSGMKAPPAHNRDTMGDMPGMTAGQPPTHSGSMADMPVMKGMDMSAGAQPAPGMAAMPGMVEPEIPHSPPPPPPGDHAADHFFDRTAMEAARATLRQEHGGAPLSMVMVSLAEYQARSGGGGYRWEGQGWFGGDVNRFVVKSEGEGSRREGLDSAEVQALYSRAIGPYFNIQAGARQDFAPRSRTYATIGVQGLVPYWFDVEGAIFISTKGEVLGRFESTYDLRFSQRLILQPRVELNLAAQDTLETRTGSGLSNAELGLRLRYEIRREFAPYIGVSYDQKVGKTADYARALGQNPAATSFVVGIRAWF